MEKHYRKKSLSLLLITSHTFLILLHVHDQDVFLGNDFKGVGDWVVQRYHFEGFRPEWYISSMIYN